jgi:hypothetical protein
MVRPIEPFAKTNKEYHYKFPNNRMENKLSNGGKKKAKNTLSFSHQASLFGKDFGSAPELPPAIMDAPKVRNDAHAHSVSVPL